MAAAALHKLPRIGDLKAAAAHWVVPARCLNMLTSTNMRLCTIHTHTYISTYTGGKKLVGARWHKTLKFNIIFQLRSQRFVFLSVSSFLLSPILLLYGLRVPIFSWQQHKNCSNTTHLNTSIGSGMPLLLWLPWLMPTKLTDSDGELQLSHSAVPWANQKPIWA